jgi:hypothetical protein
MDFQIILALLEHKSLGWITAVILLATLISVAFGIVAKAIVSITKDIGALKKSKQPISPNDYKEQVKEDTAVVEILRTVRHDMNSDRVLILQFHNGIHSIAHNHLLKVSATHEATSPNVPAIITEISGWPTNYLGVWGRDIFENHYLAWDKAEYLKLVKDAETSPNMTEDHHNVATLRGIADYLIAHNVEHMWMFPITDARGAVFGMAMVQQVGRKQAIYPEMVKWASQRFHAIGALLTQKQLCKVEGDDGRIQ